MYSLNPAGFHWRTEYTTCSSLADTYISAVRTIFPGVVSIAQWVEVTDSAELGGIVERRCCRDR